MYHKYTHVSGWSSIISRSCARGTHVYAPVPTYCVLQYTDPKIKMNKKKKKVPHAYPCAPDVSEQMFGCPGSI